MNIILGAGFTGMSAGIKTGYPIYEASDHAGGICRSYQKDGFQFSTGGGHWLFGSGPGLDYIKSLVEVNEYERVAGIYYNHTFPYPFQTTAGEDTYPYKGGTLRTALNLKFGKEQCNLFFNPFNEKYTAGLYDKIIQTDDYKSPPAGGKGFCSTFCDPVYGLIDLVARMANKCTINYGHKLIDISTAHKVAAFRSSDASSESFRFDKLISTIPLNSLINMPYIKSEIGVPPDLPYTSVLVINIGADPETNTPTEHWMYIPFCKSNFYRVGFYSNVNKKYAPEGKVGLSVEMAFHNTKYEDLDIENICFEVIAELQSWRWIGKVITVDPTWVDCAYTWLYDRKDRDDTILWLKERDIISIGRYGKWQFQGMIQSIEDGLNVNISDCGQPRPGHDAT